MCFWFLLFCESLTGFLPWIIISSKDVVFRLGGIEILSQSIWSFCCFIDLLISSIMVIYLHVLTSCPTVVYLFISLYECVRDSSELMISGLCSFDCVFLIITAKYCLWNNINFTSYPGIHSTTYQQCLTWTCFTPSINDWGFLVPSVDWYVAFTNTWTGQTL